MGKTLYLFFREFATSDNMVFKIYGVKNFSGTQNVLIVLEELKSIGIDVPYEVVTVDVANAAHKDEEYLQKMQPFGQTPVLVCLPLIVIK